MQNDSSLSLVPFLWESGGRLHHQRNHDQQFRPRPESGWIKIIGVHPKHMGTGIGQSLIIELLKQFKKKKINEIYATARWDAVDILSFFKSIGFNRSNFFNLCKKLGQKE